MDIETINGRFIYTVYKTDSYMVSSFETDDGKITVTGPSFNYIRNRKYTLVGNYIDHPKYGFQFNYSKVDDFLPKESNEIVSFLSSVTFKGIGKKTAEKIYDYFKDETLTILKNDPQRILELNLSEKQISSIIDGFNSLQDPRNEAIYQLITGGFSNSESLRIYDYFKDNTDIAIKLNPFKIYLDVYGISFSKVCDYSSKIDFEDKDMKLKEAFIVYTIKQLTFNKGDTYLIKEEIEKQYYHNFNDDQLDNIINKCIDDKYVIVEDNRYYLYEEYYNEIYIADFLRRKKKSLNLDSETIDQALNVLSNELEIQYDNKQVLAIKEFFNNNISIITGGPGTGKTTIVKSLVYIFKNYLPFNNIVVVAPTGRAAKRISEICNVESKTIHSLLRWDKETNTFAFNEDNSLLYDAIIIDEFSMVDNFLFASLLKACSNIKKICLIGDPNQLPSIRQGNILEDIIKSNLFSLTKLDYNHRQFDGSEIIDLSKDIIEENVNLNKYVNDVISIENFDNSKLLELIDTVIDNGQSLDDVKVLAPMYKGTFGIDNLNSVLQSYFNPKDKKKKEKLVNGVIYREGDRILQLKNRPTDDVFNGDIGVLEEINENDKYFLINYSDVYVFYKFEDLNEISLAYCLSVHKAQGSEYKTCIFVLPNASKGMLNKKLIYTAISRAKSKLYILGSKENFYRGSSLESKKRKTSLLQRLTNVN